MPLNQRIAVGNYENVFKFETVRQWCVETWGDSPIFDIWWLAQHLQGNSSNLIKDSWTYDVSNRNGVPVMRLYFRSEKELSLYELKWS